MEEEIGASTERAPTDSPRVGASPLDRIRVGVAGWSYPDWRSVFYPAERPPGFRELRFAAELFDCLEINSTFYSPVAARVAASWLEQVRDLPDFVFTAKLHRALTHHATEPSERKQLGAAFADGLKPLVDAGRLACVVVQFPWYLTDGPAARELIASLAEILAPIVLAVEVRDRSFIDAGEQGALRFLEQLGVNFVNIDLPRAATSPPPTCINTSSTGYFRLHGRNARNWFAREAGRDAKYDYLYTVDELRDLAPAIERLAARATATYVVMNNHFRAQAAVNAFQLAEMLHGERRSAPASLATTYAVLEHAQRRGSGQSGVAPPRPA